MALHRRVIDVMMPAVMRTQVIRVFGQNDNFDFIEL
jgi:hypothetical protein